MTGNGISLCLSCHKESHSGFNGRPDLLMPMDGEGGEKIEVLTTDFSELALAASQRWLGLRPEYYNLSEQVLAKFKLLQGFEWNTHFPGTPIEQAAAIWRATPQQTLRAVLRSNLLDLVKNE